MRRLTFIFILTSTLINYSYSIQKCGYNCILCTKENTCRYCYKIPLVNDSCDKDSLDNYIPYCEIYKPYKKCLKCIEGYGLKGRNCHKVDIENCVLSHFNYKEERFECHECRGGYPDPKDSTKCLEFKESHNCEIGFYDGKEKCSRCRDGYVLRGENNCEERMVPGCLHYKEEECLVCDYKNGFMLRANGKCDYKGGGEMWVGEVVDVDL